MNLIKDIDPSIIARYTSTWSPSSIPTQTTLSYVDPTNINGIQATLSMIEASAYAATELKQLYYLQRDYRAAQASLTLALAQEYLQTATATQYFPQATLVIQNATLNLIALNTTDNPYGTQLNLIPNLLFTVLFGILLVYNCIFLIKSKELYFSICFICGTGCEFAGYIARTLAVHNLINADMFLCQIICLTMAPAFLMAGVYILLAQLIVIHGRQYSILKPLWFSYIFITCDLLSLIIQAVGGGMAGMALQNFRSTVPGTNVMVAGIAFQVLTMTLFLFLFFDFVYRIYFKSSSQVKPSIINFFRLLFNTPKGKYFKSIQDDSFAVKYQQTRQRKLFNWMPLVVLLTVIFIYIRCIYRVIELTEGWTGYLITHEEYVFTLDGMMVLLCCFLYVGFHPRIVFGKFGDLTIKGIKENHDEMNNLDREKHQDVDSFDEKYAIRYPPAEAKPVKHSPQRSPSPYRQTQYSNDPSFRGSTLGTDSDETRRMQVKLNAFNHDSITGESITDFSIHSAEPHAYRNGATKRVSDQYYTDGSSIEEPTRNEKAQATQNPYKSNYQEHPYTFKYHSQSEDSFEFS